MFRTRDPALDDLLGRARTKFLRRDPSPRRDGGAALGSMGAAKVAGVDGLAFASGLPTIRPLSLIGADAARHSNRRSQESRVFRAVE